MGRLLDSGGAEVRGFFGQLCTRPLAEWTNGPVGASAAVPRTPPPPARQTEVMGLVFSVQGEDPDEVAGALARMCRLLGLEVSLSATRSVGTGRYMARGVPVRPEPVAVWEAEG